MPVAYWSQQNQYVFNSLCNSNYSLDKACVLTAPLRLFFVPLFVTFGHTGWKRITYHERLQSKMVDGQVNTFLEVQILKYLSTLETKH